MTTRAPALRPSTPRIPSHSIGSARYQPAKVPARSGHGTAATRSLPRMPEPRWRRANRRSAACRWRRYGIGLGASCGEISGSGRRDQDPRQRDRHPRTEHGGNASRSSTPWSTRTLRVGDGDRPRGPPRRIIGWPDRSFRATLCRHGTGRVAVRACATGGVGSPLLGQQGARPSADSRDHTRAALSLVRLLRQVAV